jgi:hypothetical protein
MSGPKAEIVKKTRPFEREELDFLYECPMEGIRLVSLLLRPLIHGLQSACETCLLHLEDIKEVRTNEGKLNYLVDFSRQKPRSDSQSVEREKKK